MSAPARIPYAELQVTSNFSFLRGASHADELVLTAAALGLEAVGITDRNTLAGVVRAHVAAKEIGLRLVVGCRLDLEDAPSLLVWPMDRAAYGRLSTLLTVGLRRSPKGQCQLRFGDLAAHAEGQMVAILPPGDWSPRRPDTTFALRAAELASLFSGRACLAASVRHRGDDKARLAGLAALATGLGVPLLATNDVHYHVPERRPLQDVMTAVRHHCTVAEAGLRLHAHAERHMKPGAEMARLFGPWAAALETSLEITRRCTFSLDELRYEYPSEPVPDGRTPQEELVRLTWEGALKRYDVVSVAEVPEGVRAILEHELALIEQLAYAPYFLTVHDIVRFARGRGILCQGRGSAANSAVCFCLGITAVDPVRADLLFERFISAARNEPPDIDVDFEHERREEVIQYIYAKYGRDRAGIAATVITYRPKSAIRDVGKARGLSLDTVGALAAGATWWSGDVVDGDQVRELGLDPDDPVLARAIALARELMRFPRHLSQHVGGFVITQGPLSEVVPIANAAMAERTHVEWDKDDLDALGILKIDVLALGMLTCIRKALTLVGDGAGNPLDIAHVPAEDPAVYDMLCRADSVGVFQVESRAQMSMLPRLRPRTFYDLVIEVAIVRPGPIQGDMVHPYLRRRRGEEPVEFPSVELERVLGKTLGVPLFQEQAMRIAIVAAGFTPDEADRLRRAMASFRKAGAIPAFRQKLVEGMVRNGYDAAFADRCFRQIEGFGEYGFPESHAASFALLVYVSAWLKCHHPAAFACALLNSQPMGFSAPAQLVRDARDHGVEVLAPDVTASDWDCTLESGRSQAPGRSHAPVLRLGLCQIRGLAGEAGRALVAARGEGGPFADPADLARRSGLGPGVLERLADADAFRGLGLDRRRALWAVKGLAATLATDSLPLFAAIPPGPPASAPAVEVEASLPEMSLGQHVVADYAALRLSLKAHPLSFLRPGLARDGVVTAADLGRLPHGARAQVAGLVLVRQRPGSANGVIFATLEDETGVVNLVIWNRVFEDHRRVVLGSRLLAAKGEVQREGIVIHLVAETLTDESLRLRDLGGRAMPRSRDFR